MSDASSPDPIDGLIAELESELTDFWRRGRVRARDRSHEIHPSLDPSCYPLLMAVARREPIGMSDLVHGLGVDKSTVSRQVDAVERLGLVERRPDPEDARARVVALTDDGRSRISAVFATHVPQWRARLAQWDPADIGMLIELMRRLATSLEDFDRAE
ncbi:MarR family winged helix-turn-helix transcriptional regulator [Gordonia crocea]|uniref:MarR family transcriptional regulator n=1 Tax=Gordonia crocea TaxID=589162 RepID=A0A7I9V041_9ACTN|nr:MarR family winged helix-turn-helix transcriptional regulator [Gordonia crocea]GED98804.1 MarR family transcriptional regulator [Gordonia crocea]